MHAILTTEEQSHFTFWAHMMPHNATLKMGRSYSVLPVARGNTSNYHTCLMAL